MACCRYRVLHHRQDGCQQRAGAPCPEDSAVARCPYGPPVLISALVGADAAPGYVIPSQFDNQVAPAVAAAVPAQSRAVGVARR